MFWYFVWMIIFWFGTRYLYHILLVKNYQDLRAHAVEASIFIIDEVISDFISNKDKQPKNLSAQEITSIACWVAEPLG